MLTKDEIINVLKTNINELRKKYGIENIYLFGSYAYGNPNDNSDIDLALEVKDVSFKKLRNFFSIQESLKSKLNKEIDLVYIDKDSINPIIFNDITKRSIKVE